MLFIKAISVQTKTIQKKRNIRYTHKICGVSIKYTNKLEFDNGLNCVNVLIKASIALASTN